MSVFSDDDDVVSSVLARWASDGIGVDAWVDGPAINFRIAGCVYEPKVGCSFAVHRGPDFRVFLMLHGDVVEEATAATAETCDRGTVVTLVYDDMRLRIADYVAFENVM